MRADNNLTLRFDQLSIEDVGLVGGKNAALGEMVANLRPLGVNVPDGFAITAHAYNYFIDHAGLREPIARLLTGLKVHEIDNLQKTGEKVRKLISKADFPRDLIDAITLAYQQLGGEQQGDNDVAVRSSATAEDLPGASFAGQQETYLNVVGIENVLGAAKRCMASLFTDRAISYREDRGFSHFDVALSVGVQKMVRSDLAASGVIFTIDTETGFDGVVIIDSIYGLGEMIVQGKVTPDEFTVFKSAFKEGYSALISRKLGKKDQMMVYAGDQVDSVQVPLEKQNQFSLAEDEVLRLADWAIKIEDHFSQKHGHYQPMDIEWAKDGRSGELFIVQARPETVHSTQEKTVYRDYILKGTGVVLTTGIAVGKKIASGQVRVIQSVSEIKKFQKGEVLVTEITDPDWEPIMKIAAAIVTDKGGRTSHAAIVSRELGIPCIVGTEGATQQLKDGQVVTVDCSSGTTGKIYSGQIEYATIEHRLDEIPETRTKLMVNIGSPDEAFKNHFLPVKGVGLGRLEFIIGSYIQIHPNALVQYEELKRKVEGSQPDPTLKYILEQINQLTSGYTSKTQYYIDELAEGIAKIGVAFWPHEVIIRFSDFKTNEYATLIGGQIYEPQESNPMIGWRGASRYYHPDFEEAFGLECQAIKKVREKMGLKNVVVMIPFCRTVQEGKQVIKIMNNYGLSRVNDSGLKVYVMCEIPSNVELADDFLDIFDGMSIGSNDLTQLTLGLDRDSEIVSRVGNENDPAVKSLLRRVIDKCKSRGKYVGICGQAPSDFPEITEFLVEAGIESISVTPDTVIKTLKLIAEKETHLRK